MSSPIPFVKMHGLGNDYVYVDTSVVRVDDPAELARAISDRRTGIGSDGLILIEPSEHADGWMRMFNADGSAAETCGNGLRCVAKWLFDRGRAGRQMTLETGHDTLDTVDVEVTDVADARARAVRITFQEPSWERETIPMRGPKGRVLDESLDVGGSEIRITALSLGNPHGVIFVPSVDDAPVASQGAALQADARFPASLNVEFVEIITRHALRQRTYERGSGETFACGSGAVAAALAAIATGRADSPVCVTLLGGPLTIAWDGEGTRPSMTGAASEVFAGVFQPR